VIVAHHHLLIWRTAVQQLKSQSRSRA
jgi:hypothetical protein